LQHVMCKALAGIVQPLAFEGASANLIFPRVA
jgi:hypothetical protein